LATASGTDPSVDERHVQPAKGGHRRINNGSNLVFGGDVARNAEGLVAGGRQLVGGRAERVVIDVGQDYSGAGLGEGLRGDEAHAGAAASDQGDLAGEVVTRVHEFSWKLLHRLAAVDDHRRSAQGRRRTLIARRSTIAR
jgi:hypothetical protein